MPVSSRKTGLMVCFFLIGYTASAFSAPLNPAERNETQQRQSEVIEQSRQQREALQQLNNIVQAPLKADNAPQGPCFTLREIRFNHSTLLRLRDQTALTAGYLNRCNNLEQINQLVHDVSNWYIQRGYITSRAFLSEQDLSGGVLQLEILEGRLEKITINNQTERMTRTAFPAREGEILNLRDIEQGMEQMNRMPSQQVTIEIQPGSQPGYSVVNLTREARLPFTGGVTFDNSGQKSTGEQQLNGSLALDNLFGVADQWFISAGHSSRFATSHDAESLQAGVSMPYGYWSLGYSYSQSRYRNTFISRDFPWHSTGDSDTHRFSLSRVVFRDGTMKTAIAGTFSQRTGNNYLNGTLLPSSSRKLSSVALGVNHSQKLWGGLATFNPTYNRGVRWLGAETDTDKSADEPRAEFNKWTLSASYYYPVTDNITYLGSLYGQYSARALYGSEQLTLGGESSVRGFREQYTSGNRGAYWRNELNWQAWQLPVLGSVTFMAAVDGGHLYNHKQDDATAASLWGGAVGVTVASRWLSQQVTVGWPISYPAWLQPDTMVVGYRVGLSF
ncbi:ShlB/FhaC/HecB family hemolysin secretion/activation protein [Dickeya dianthicola]|uniref:ShlB/FhaC/HecB family hemolysin secretion/activation protein n=1 Tax=Dickeya dianthicola TaxID=204039 RepID=UPI0013706C2F|nr:ShlB/FhaC/HecB family hemolysin secretion/activation protein [Dickeya dianthicola]MCI4237795.1 ShlB/FhaC/HecB family hemolysin secretion/activation protein [Dickeya dianthicola]MCI4256197.1 ShlB/FhaC/HecB family hemolysin secretion/activation protein [Dickeya dianthicola]MZG23432.1 ShlB/FhaC/HecB family hemolysin secretion/activation protein [Dickeya dianthicola]MZI90675.1 ShlB/FhaC/HecB family hemolysin secretion/activation protein [Dickeya dianthicola]